jgi:CubicO group peptidase (beta-lactamase class C family)
MNALEREFEEATSTAKISGTILTAADKEGTNHTLMSSSPYFQYHKLTDSITGSFDYLKSFGNVALDKDASPVSASSTMCLASATKLVTCVAAMQCVERGLMGLDDDISTWLPEWKDPLILKGFTGEDKQEPILEKAEKPILLRSAVFAGPWVHSLTDIQASPLTYQWNHGF